MGTHSSNLAMHYNQRQNLLKATEDNMVEQTKEGDLPAIENYDVELHTCCSPDLICDNNGKKSRRLGNFGAEKCASPNRCVGNQISVFNMQQVPSAATLLRGDAFWCLKEMINLVS